MFSEFYAFLGTVVARMTANPVEDILLILSACAVVTVFSAVLLARAIRRRLSNKSK